MNIKRERAHYLISSAVNELGQQFGYSNLIYWARENGINMDKLDDEIKELAREGLLRIFIDIRCPNCGAHIGSFNCLSEIPKRVTCSDCGKPWIRDEDLENSYELILTTTEEGRYFFRPTYYSRILFKIKRERRIEKSLRQIFERKRQL